MIKAKPMLFNAEMARALLGGRKTQTRRPIKPLPEAVDYSEHPKWPCNAVESMISVCTREQDPLECQVIEHYCPFGKKGDLIWVREAWRIGAWNENNQVALDYKADDYADPVLKSVHCSAWLDKQVIKMTNQLQKKGIKTNGYGNYEWERGESPLGWAPSIHMPRWASRTTLEITDVRVERIQSITKSDAEAEGFKLPPADNQDGWAIGARTNFRNTWERTYGDSWNKNDWVWVIEFKVHKMNVDLLLKEAEEK